MMLIVYSKLQNCIWFLSRIIKSSRRFKLLINVKNLFRIPRLSDLLSFMHCHLHSKKSVLFLKTIGKLKNINIYTVNQSLKLLLHRFIY